MERRQKLTPVVEEIRQYFLNCVEKTRVDHPKVSFYIDHVTEVEKWAKYILKDHPEANSETVLLAVWLHDIGNLIGDRKIDHAIRSEREARLILPEMGLSPEEVDAVAHCVRAHRNNDVPPYTVEAKIVAAADSASHMTGEAYLVFAGRNDIEGSIAKLERDYRDIGLVPNLQEVLTPFYQAWKELLKVYPKFD